METSQLREEKEEGNNESVTAQVKVDRMRRAWNLSTILQVDTDLMGARMDLGAKQIPAVRSLEPYTKIKLKCYR